MKATSLFLCILFFVQLKSIKTINFDDISTIIDLGEKFSVVLFKTIGIAIESNLSLPVPVNSNKKVLEHVIEISNQLNTVIQRVEANENFKELFISLQHLPMEIEFRNRINQFNEIYIRISSAFDYYGLDNISRININEIGFENLTILNYAQSAISHEHYSIRNALITLYNLIHPLPLAFHGKNIFEQFTDLFQKLESVKCSLQQSPNQFIQSLYQLISITETKGHAVMEFSYALLRSFNKGDFKEEKQLECQKHRERLNGITKVTIEALKTSSRAFYRCDPSRFEKGKNYEEITELLQGYIENEVDMNKEDTCRETCDYYTVAESYGCLNTDHCNKFKRRCKGKIRNCRFIDSDMKICPSKNSVDSHRRYDYIYYENNEVFGQLKTCKQQEVQTDSWWRWLFWHCSYCMCLCDEQGIHSDRYFGLNEVLSDSKNNKVVTGLKFTKKNRIIFLQIQQGKLLANGSIDKNTVEWAPVPNYFINNTRFREGRDYFSLDYNTRAIDLDDLERDEQHLLTGVRFKTVGSHLNFQVQITPFNFSTGTLDLVHQMWIQNLETEVSNNPRQKLDLDDRDIPIKSTNYHSFPDSESNQYIEFTHTGFKNDVAQTTVPFIDIQEVTPLIPTPLTGAGIYHRGQSDLGGFIAPKIFTFDLSKYLSRIDFQTKRKCEKIAT